MNRFWNMVQAGALVLLVLSGSAAQAWAVDIDADANEQPGSSTPQAGYPQTSYPQAGAAASEVVIGYQPIPNSTLAAISSTQATAQTVSPLQQPGGPIAPSRNTKGSQREQAYDFTTWFVGQGPYTLGRDDAIRIQVRNQPEFSGDFLIGPEGEIQYNYLGDIPIAGLTKYEVQQVLEKMLARYIRVPAVNVTIVGYNSKVVYVIGEVNRPGKYIMRGDVIKLREAIIAAGLPTGTAALRRTHVIKPDLRKPRDRKVDLKRILYKGKLKDDIDLYPGEIVVVPSTVLASVNSFLSQLLNPLTHAATVAALGAGL
ncbi:MAG: polysaccharide biosynthesis/export family protein [Candidatus Omnitrophica bacterium]|nr:polysaccharide biosynthesis/export family protein [Candidatus Omnitrophota bacterium]